jgi:ATP-dependent DNA ligase
MACKNSSHLYEMVKEVIEEEGEGLIVQRAASEYEHGRTLSLIKLKVREKKGVKEMEEREEREEREGGGRAIY